MLDQLRRLPVAVKVSLLGFLFILVTLSALTYYVVKSSQSALYAGELSALNRDTQRIHDMVEVYDTSLRRPTESLMKVFRAMFTSNFLVSE